MERLTRRLSSGAADYNINMSRLNCAGKSVYRQKCVEALAAYEDTGLEPEDIRQLTDDIESRFLVWIEKHYGISGARFTELMEAKRDGRCLILPSRSIAARYDVADMLQDDLKESSFSDPSVGIFGLTWAEGELWQAVIDGLNKGRAEAEAAQGGGVNG